MSYAEDWDNTIDKATPSRGGEEVTSEMGQRALHVLRRRWKFIVLLAAVLTPPLAYAGWKAGKVEYTSTATVHVRPTLQTILYRDEEKGVLPMYDSYVNTQMELLRNRRVVDLAVQDPRWQRAYGAATAEAVSEFMDDLMVSRRGELVSLSVRADSPTVAQAGAVSVIGAYRRIYVEQDNQSDEQRLATLQQRQSTLTAEAALLRQKIIAAANDFGTEDLEPLYQARQSQVSQLEIEIQKMRLMGPATQPAEAANGPREITTAREAAAIDRTIADLIARRDETARRDDIDKSAGLGATHPRRAANARELAAYDRDIETRFQELRESGMLKTATPGSAEDTAERVKQLEKLLETNKTELLTLGRQQLVISELRREEGRVREEIDRVKRRIDQLNIESTMAGRLQVVNEGEVPVRPSKDSRMRNAGMGATGGLFIAFVAVIGIGLLDRRVRNLDDVAPRGGTGPILGVLPEIPEGLEDPALAAQAAHNVHHIRTMLEVWANGKMPLSLTCTSPSSGSGKTSLTLSLGVSFAAAGLRTLLIDLDVVGGGLTSRFEAMTRRRLGSLMVAKGIITDVQRMEALKQATATGQKLGEVCINMGYATADQIRDALEAQAAAVQRAGVIEALEGKALSECVSDSGIPGLWVLGLGTADMSHATSMSSQRIRRLIQRAGKDYDIILIDTGPSPGSLEAGAATIATDGAILAIARGEERQAVNQCVAHLTKIGAKLAGVVFNRATGREMARLSTSRSSNFGSVPRSTPRLPFDTSIEAPVPLSDMNSPARMGPVAGAVANTVRPTRGDDVKGGEQ